MKVSIDIDDELSAQVDAFAAETGRSVSTLIEDALKRFIGEPSRRKSAVNLPQSKETGWVHAGIDINDARSVREAGG